MKENAKMSDKRNSRNKKAHAVNRDDEPEGCHGEEIEDENEWGEASTPRILRQRLSHIARQALSNDIIAFGSQLADRLAWWMLESDYHEGSSDILLPPREDLFPGMSPLLGQVNFYPGLSGAHCHHVAVFLRLERLNTSWDLWAQVKQHQQICPLTNEFIILTDSWSTQMDFDGAQRLGETDNVHVFMVNPGHDAHILSL